MVSDIFGPCFSYVYVRFDLEFQCFFLGGGRGWQQSDLMKQRRRTNQMRNNEKWYPPRLSLYWHQSAQTCEFVFERSSQHQKKTTHVDMKVQGLQNVARCRCISTTHKILPWYGWDASPPHLRLLKPHILSSSEGPSVAGGPTEAKEVSSTSGEMLTTTAPLLRVVFGVTQWLTWHGVWMCLDVAYLAA